MLPAINVNDTSKTTKITKSDITQHIDVSERLKSEVLHKVRYINTLYTYT